MVSMSDLDLTVTGMLELIEPLDPESGNWVINEVQKRYDSGLCGECGEYVSLVLPGQCWKCSPDGRDDDD
jgi:hypothetical protein